MKSNQLLIFLALATFCSSSSSPRTKKLCLYLKAIRRTTVECSDFSEESSSMSPLARIIANIEKRNEKLRKTKKCAENYTDGFKDCRADASCFSGFSCENSKNSRCCMEENATTHQKMEDIRTCPAIKKMSFFCDRVSKTCENDEDCLFSGIQRCCDTGCGFNVCVVASGNISKNTLIFLGT